MLSCECIPVVVKWSDDSYSPVDINTRSTVLEHPPHWEVSDILTSKNGCVESTCDMAPSAC